MGAKVMPIRKNEGWKPLPSAEETESAVVGILVAHFHDRELPGDVGARLRGDLFHNEPQRSIVAAVLEVGAFPPLVFEHLKQSGSKVRLSQILQYAEEALPLLVLPRLIDSLHTYVEARSAVRATREASELASKGNAQEARKVLGEYCATPPQGGDGLEAWKPATGSVDAAIERIERLERGENDGWITGLGYFDEVVNSSLGGGLQPGTLGVVAGRPGRGKTTWTVELLCETLARNPGNEHREGLLCAFFSFEMVADQVAQKVLARHTPPTDGVGPLKACDLSAAARSSVASSQLARLWINDSSGMYIDEIIDAADRLYLQGFRVFALDYIQRVKLDVPPELSRFGFGEVSKRLATHAKDRGVAWVACSQLNRSAENRKVPTMGDLKESGDIEQDASWIVALHTSQVEPDDHKRVGFYVLKNRFGSGSWSRELIADWGRQRFRVSY